jgi:hypothetical protein
MKKHVTILSATLLMLLSVSCKRNKEVAAVPVKDFPSIENILPIQLPAEINYKEHFFEASWDELHMKSLPPQVNVRLTHVNNDDACRARIEKELAIDLRKLFLNIPNDVVVILNGNVEGKILVAPQE